MSTAPASRQILSWWVCGLLLCASTINYMDRQTLSTVSKRITTEFDITNSQYGYVELGFGLAFAVGSVVFGIIADRTNVRWLYPIVVLLWSLMAFLTGFVETFAGLLVCRTLLGLFEAGHWPCALKTTLRLLPPQDRALGNSVLQSGTAIGAIVTPLIMLSMLTEEPGSWRYAFQSISGIGVFWVVAWIASTNSADLAPVPSSPTDTSADTENVIQTDDDSLLSTILSRRFLILIVMVIGINLNWHIFRVWMPKFLQSGPGYDEPSMFKFMFQYNVLTDVGCIAAGFLTRFLHAQGFTTHLSRSAVFGLCAMLVLVGCLIPWVPSGWELVVVLTCVALGSLGLFPCYYSFSQELSTRHQGKVLGLLGLIAWCTSAPVHPLLGHWADVTKSYHQGLAISCAFPLVSFLALVLFWPVNKPEVQYNRDASLA